MVNKISHKGDERYQSLNVVLNHWNVIPAGMNDGRPRTTAFFPHLFKYWIAFFYIHANKSCMKRVHPVIAMNVGR